MAAFYESEEGLIPGETLLFGDYSIKGKRLEEPVETAVASRYSGIKKTGAGAPSGNRGNGKTDGKSREEF